MYFCKCKYIVICQNHFTAIEDFDNTIKFILVLFFVDLGRLVISASVLWKFCRINFYKAFAALQTEFGVAFGQNIAILVVAVSSSYNT